MAEQHPFDRLARTLAQPQSRRALLRQLGVGLAAAAAGSVAPRVGRSLADSPCATGLSLCGTACKDLQSDPNNCGSCGNALPSGGQCVNGKPAQSYTQTPAPPLIILQQTVPNQDVPALYDPSRTSNGAPVASSTTSSSDGSAQPHGGAQDVVCKHLGDNCLDAICCAGEGLACLNSACCRTFANACASASDCCSNLACTGSVCCDGLGTLCNPAVPQCCPGSMCGGNVGGNLICCLPDSSTCSSSLDCCNGNCQNGVCGTCRPAPQSCATGEECCSHACQNGACCTVEGGTCASSAECCEGNCDTGICQKCRPTGATCTTGNDCCGGACLSGMCGCGPGAPCASGFTCCDGACVDLATDSNNCGSCAHECQPCHSETGISAESICSGGVCQPAESAGGLHWMICNGVCTDVNSDPNNCGRCGSPCPICSLGVGNGQGANDVPEICIAGACAAPPAGAFLLNGLNPAICLGVCVDLNSNPLNCGSCDHICLDGPCVAGLCTCREGKFSCGQGCCDNGVICCNHQCCAAGITSCQADGSCGCPSGQTACGAGVCCSAGQCCAGGSCTTCQSDQTCAATGQYAGQCVCSSTGAPPVNGVCTCPQNQVCGNTFCFAGQRCVNNQCICDGTSCPDGCCTTKNNLGLPPNMCLPVAGQWGQACGTGGQVCANCAALSADCIAGACGAPYTGPCGTTLGDYPCCPGGTSQCTYESSNGTQGLCLNPQMKCCPMADGAGVQACGAGQLCPSPALVDNCSCPAGMAICGIQCCAPGETCFNSVCVCQ